MAARETILQRLDEQELHLLVEHRGRLLFASDREGFGPLAGAVFGRPDLFDGSDAALPAIGLGAACLLIHGKVGRIYAEVMTYETRRLLDEEGIEHLAEQHVRKLPEDHAPIGALDDRAREAVSVAAFVEEVKRQRS